VLTLLTLLVLNWLLVAICAPLPCLKRMRTTSGALDLTKMTLVVVTTRILIVSGVLCLRKGDPAVVAMTEGASMAGGKEKERHIEVTGHAVTRVLMILFLRRSASLTRLGSRLALSLGELAHAMSLSDFVSALSATAMPRPLFLCS
jgi:hypothetical protein